MAKQNKQPWKMTLDEYQNRPMVIPFTACGHYVAVAQVLRKFEWSKIVCFALMDGKNVPRGIVEEYLRETCGALPPWRQNDYAGLESEVKFVDETILCLL